MAFIPTNTLAKGGFDVLKMDHVDEPLININNLTATLDFDESYLDTLNTDFFIELDNLYTEALINSYKIIAEGTSYYALTEATNGIIGKIYQILDKATDVIIKILDKIILKISKFCNNDFLIWIPFTDLRKKFDDGMAFDYTFQKYFLDPDDVNTTEILYVLSIVNTSDIDLKESTISDELKSSILGQFCSKIFAKDKGNVFGEGYKYNKDTFKEDLDRHFCNGEKGQSEIIKIDSETLYDIFYETMKGYNKKIKKLKTKKKDTLKSLKDCQTKLNSPEEIDRIFDIKADNALPSGSNDQAVDLDLMRKNGATIIASLITEVMSIYSLALSAQIKYITEDFKQRKTAVTMALDKASKKKQD